MSIKADAASVNANPYDAPFVVDCTAYDNKEGNVTYSGKPTIQGVTIAGKKEWIGCVASLYEVNEDGSMGDWIGYYEFTDTGYGRDGDIERGETVDLYFDSEQDAIEWGRKKVYLQVIHGVG